MLSQLQGLLLLQSLDIQIREAEEHLRQIPLEIQNIEEKRRTREKDMDGLKDELEDQRKTQRKLEAELADNEQRLIKLNTQLNHLKSNEEYRGMLKQIETVKFQNSDIESAILETLEEIDSRKRSLTRSTNGLEDFIKEIDLAIQLRKHELETGKQKLQELHQERLATRQEVDLDALQHYDRLLASNQLPCVAAVENDSCGGCHLNIRPNVLIESKKTDKLSTCEMCFRFIYWKSEAPESPPEIPESIPDQAV